MVISFPDPPHTKPLVAPIKLEIPPKIVAFGEIDLFLAPPTIVTPIALAVFPVPHQIKAYFAAEAIVLLLPTLTSPVARIAPLVEVAPE